jgi:hypothetical protein
MSAENYLTLEDAPESGGFRMDDYWVWCGSVIEEPGKGFHMLAARWPKKYPMFYGYILRSEIVRAWSPTMTGPYKFMEKVLPPEDPARWDGRMAHNPTVLKHGNKYLLYYIASTYPEETPAPEMIESSKKMLDSIYSRIRIGVAVADSPSGPWRTFDKPILDTRPGKWDAPVVTNPAPCVLPDGRIFMYYRSNTPAGLRIGLAAAEKPEGPYVRVQDDPVLEGFNVEDPFVWHDGKTFHMLAKDMTGAITGEYHAGAHFLSGDGVKWETAPQPKGYSRVVRFQGGKTCPLGCLERPQLLFGTDGRPKCMFAAAGDGPGGFHKALNTWNIAIPLSARD